MSTPPPPALDPGGVLAIDNVRVELPLAGLGSRSLAAALDLLLLSFVQVLWIAVFAFVGSMVGMRSGWLVAALVFGIFALQWGYFAVLEVMMDGQTPGKLAIGLRVVSVGGGRASAGAIVARAILRTVDLVVGVPMLFLDPRCRRLGDVLAGTVVVHDRDPQSASGRSGGAEAALHRLPAGWGGREAALVESFLDRAERMEPERAERLAERLLACIERDDPALGAEVAGRSESAMVRLRLAVAGAEG